MHALSPSLLGYGLTTANILYRFPDHQLLLQTYIWQDFDTEPEFPKLRAFLDFWERNLDGPLFSVKISHALLVSPDDLNLANLH
jgi:uncharacterized protein Usg